MRLHRLFTVCVLTVAGVGLALLLADRMAAGRRLLYERLQTRAQTMAESAAMVALPALKDRRPLDKRALRLLARQPSVSRIAVFDGQDRLVFEALPASREARPAGLLPVSVDVADADRRYGRVGLWMNVAATQRTLWRLSSTGLLLAPGVLALLAFTVLWLGRLVGRHLQDFAKALAERRPETLQALPNALQASELGDIANAFRDLEERLSREESARRETERLRDQMAGMIVHDLRHPVNVVKTVLDMLRDPDFASAAPSERDKRLGMAQRALGRLDAMIADILHFARLNDPTLSIERRRLGLRRFLLECAEESRLVCEHSKRRFRTRLEPDTLARYVLGNDIVLRRLIGNLVEKALQHSEEGSVLTLSARLSKERPGEVEVGIHDERALIPGETLDRVFERDVAIGQGGLGIGLGLAFCRLAAEKHSGRLTAFSEPGAGTSFTLSLPSLAEPPREPAEDAPHPRAA